MKHAETPSTPPKKKKNNQYSKTCLKWPLKRRQKIGFQDRLSLNAGQKYCRMLMQYFPPSLSNHFVFLKDLCFVYFWEAILDRFYSTMFSIGDTKLIWGNLDLFIKHSKKPEVRILNKAKWKNVLFPVMSPILIFLGSGGRQIFFIKTILQGKTYKMP